MKHYLNKGLNMKAQPYYALFVSAAVYIAVAGTGLLDASAADPVAAPKGVNPVDTIREPKATPDNVLEIEVGAIVTPSSSGGKHVGKAATLKNVVEALRERYTDANIAIAPGLENVKISDLKLRTRNIWEDLEAIRVASGGEFEWQGPGSPVFSEHGDIAPGAYIMNVVTQVNPASGLVESHGGPASSGLFILRPAAVPPEKERNLEAFNIEPYIEWLLAKRMASGNPPDAKSDPREEAQKNRVLATDRGMSEIEQIIADSLAAMSQSASALKEPPQLKFHSGANILIVVGTPYQLDVVRKVISALPGQRGMAGQTPANNFGPQNPGTPSQDQQDAFRRRYGLPPQGGAPAVPGNTSQPPGPKP
jgi:hypothetical protein